MLKLGLIVPVLLTLLVPSISLAWKANVTFNAPTNPLYRTVVLVSETSGVYEESYGQISEPGATTLSIDGVQSATQYYFVAYRLTDNNIQSEYSEEYPVLTPAYVEPIVHELPAIPIAGVVLNISVTVE